MRLLASVLLLFVLNHSSVIFANCQITGDICEKPHKCCQKLEKEVSQKKELCQHELKQNWEKDKFISFAFLNNRVFKTILTFKENLRKFSNNNFRITKIPIYLKQNSLLI